MALKVKVSFKGLPETDAYVAITSVTLGAAENPRLFFSFAYQVEKGSQQFDFGSSECLYDLLGADAYAQAYEHLKAQPEFAGATDC